MRESEKEAEKESIALMEKFKNLRKHKFRLINQIQEKDEDADFDEYEDEMLEHIDKLEDDLMGVEMKLSEAL